MKMLGFLLLLSGWVIVLAAVVLLRPDLARAVFVLAGIGIESIGLVLFMRAHPLLRSEREGERD